VPGLPFRTKQLIVSTIGALLLLPLDFFFGGIFAFSFGAQESLWAWIFGLTAFWFQIFGILLSFFKPRTAALWILANITASAFVQLAPQGHAIHWLAVPQLNTAHWLPIAPSPIELALFFWAPPLLFALLLLRGGPQEERLLAATAEQAK